VTEDERKKTQSISEEERDSDGSEKKKILREQGEGLQ